MLLPLVVALAAALPELPPAVPLEEAAPGRLRAVGETPAWDVTVDPEYGFVFTDPAADAPQLEFGAAAPVKTADGYAFASGQLELKVTEQACSDGVSAYAYPYTAHAKVGSAAYRGCAYQPWGVHILAAMPAIDACLAISETPRDETVVVYAAALAEAGGFVLLRTFGDSPLRACTVTKGAASITPFEGATPPGTDFDLFVRAPGENPGGACYDAPEVLDADGKSIGWWLDPMGC